MQNKACAVICEYNPFHNGHKYQLEYIKKNFGLPCVGIMSGDFVQRGEIAFADKYSRAEKAAEHGADVILELPFPFCCMTAEKFAEKGVEIAEKSGMCSHLAFGSESGDLESIKKTAELLLDGKFIRELEKSRKENPNISFASLRSEKIAEKLGEKYAVILENPNDILAVEYVKAIIKTNSKLVPIAVERTAAHGADTAACGIFASSSYIRRSFYEKTDGVNKYIPYKITDFGIENIVSAKRRERFWKNVHLALMRETPERLKDICELSGGLEYALVNAAKSRKTIDETMEKLKSKTLTNAKIRRMMLFAFFGVTEEKARENVRYTSVLAMSENGLASELMRIARKEKQIILAQRVSAVKKDKKAYEQYQFCENAGKLLKLC